MVIVLGILAFRNIKVVSDNEKSIYVLDLSQTPCYPNGSISGLTGIDSTGCCVVNGVTTSKRIFTISSNQQMLVDTTPVFFADVCLEFCQTFDTVKNRCTDQIIGSGPYAKCINALNPINSFTTDSIATQCTQPSLPVARVGDVPYYAVEVYIPPTTNDTGNCPSVVSC